MNEGTMRSLCFRILIVQAIVLVVAVTALLLCGCNGHVQRTHTEYRQGQFNEPVIFESQAVEKK